MRLNCHKCGRFVGKGGHTGIFYDDYAGGHESSGAVCQRCLKRAKKRKGKTK